MVEEKIKVKELAEQIGAPAREMIKALHGLKASAKSMAGSVTMDEAVKLRDYFANRKTETVERSSVKPDVIVRRRRKETPPPAPEPTPVVSVEAKEDSAPESAAPREKVSSRKEERHTRKIQAPDARVISRPGDFAPPPPEPEPEKPEPPKEPEKPARQGKTLAEEIREREALARAKAREEASALRKKIERSASIISKPEAAPEVIEETPPAPPVAEEKREKKPEKSEVLREILRAEQEREPVESPDIAEIPEKPAKTLRPDASAQPTESSSVRVSETPRKVRIISLPDSEQVKRARPRSAQPRAQEAGRSDQRPASRGTPRQGQGRPAYGAQFAAGQRPAPSQPMPGLPTDSKDGQSKKKKNKGKHTVDFPRGDFGRRVEEEDAPFIRQKSKRNKQQKVQQQPVTQPIKASKRKIRVAEAIRVADMAQQMGVKANEIIKALVNLGVMATINQSLDIDTATLIASEFDYEVENVGFSEADYLAPKVADAPESLKPRPPVVTIMGHVDHGKTSLLDAIRKSNVTSGEAGGITQHIGAYHVKTKRGEIVFLDTPGHEAFTAMRARGAQITDLVILVVAADDGVMEQTREAVNHSRAANVPIMVAVNKIDKPGANPDNVLRELSELGLQPEDWGGDTIVAKVSAKTREGLDDLLELVALQSDIMDLKANPDKPARGHIVEARLDKGRGPIATVLVQEGTLRPGDNFVCGAFAGRVRAMNNDQGKKVKEAGPSMPVEVLGFEGVPVAGEEFQVVADEKMARKIADYRAKIERERTLAAGARVTLENFLTKLGDQDILTLNLVLKADVQGSLEAISEALKKENTDKVKINIVHGGTGAISESDIMLASASKAIIIGFNVRPSAKIKDIAEKEDVDIRYYDIIYKLVDDVKSAMAGLLAPVRKEVDLGQAEVRKVYHLPKIGAIAGTYVSDGKMVRNAGVRLLRDGIVIYTGKIASLKRFKDDAREVVKGNECGVGLENYNDIKEGDVLEAFETVEEAATL